jgi:hypothetical protein
MQQPFIPHRLVILMIVAAILLPVTISVVFGVASLLMKMGDSTGGGVLHRISLGFGILWAIDLICLILVQGIGSLGGPDEPE